jgi:hypothetical protein
MATTCEHAAETRTERPAYNSREGAAGNHVRKT